MLLLLRLPQPSLDSDVPCWTTAKLCLVKTVVATALACTAGCVVSRWLSLRQVVTGMHGINKRKSTPDQHNSFQLVSTVLTRIVCLQSKPQLHSITSLCPRPELPACLVFYC